MFQRFFVNIYSINFALLLAIPRNFRLDKATSRIPVNASYTRSKLALFFVELKNSEVDFLCLLVKLGMSANVMLLFWIDC